MFRQFSFPYACEIYTAIYNALPGLQATFGEAGVECIVDALHVYVREGHACDCSGFDVDFSRLFTLAFREYSGHDLLPEYSCLTDWSGASSPQTGCSNESHD